MKRIRRVLKRVLKIKSVGIEKCGSNSHPIPASQGGSWVEIDVTVDQSRIERVLETLSLGNKRLLHVGIGCSNIARKYANQTTPIDGITVVSEEKEHADSLGLSHYTTHVINKYNDEELNSLAQRYDIIVDNNLSSFACCQHHYRKMLKNYIDVLTINGMILTDSTGMNFFEDYAFPIDEKDLLELEREFPVRVLKVDESVFALKKL